MEMEKGNRDLLLGGSSVQDEKSAGGSGPLTGIITDQVDRGIPAWRSVRAVVLFSLVVVLVSATDLMLKHYAFETVAGRPVNLEPFSGALPVIPPHEAVTVVPGVLDLHLLTNDGAVFGLGKGNRWLFIIVSVLAIAIIIRIFMRSSAGAFWLHLALALILGGALGNLYDRIVYHVVRDMLLMLPGTGLWPWVFNLADAALVLGVCLILPISWFGERRRQKPESGVG